MQLGSPAVMFHFMQPIGPRGRSRAKSRIGDGEKGRVRAAETFLLRPLHTPLEIRQRKKRARPPWKPAQVALQPGLGSGSARLRVKKGIRRLNDVGCGRQSLLTPSDIERTGYKDKPIFAELSVSSFDAAIPRPLKRECARIRMASH